VLGPRRCLALRTLRVRGLQVVMLRLGRLSGLWMEARKAPTPEEGKVGAGAGCADSLLSGPWRRRSRGCPASPARDLAQHVASPLMLNLPPRPCEGSGVDRRRRKELYQAPRSWVEQAYPKLIH
jgi:hypothetical protein